MSMGYSALYLRVPRLMQYLQSIRGDEEYLKYLAKLKRINLLILDDFGVSPLKAAEARDLLEIVEDRVNQSSLIITSQLPIKDWHSYLHNATIADAILDRVVHNAYKIEIGGPSQRKENAKKAMKQAKPFFHSLSFMLQSRMLVLGLEKWKAKSETGGRIK